MATRHESEMTIVSQSKIVKDDLVKKDVETLVQVSEDISSNTTTVSSVRPHKLLLENEEKTSNISSQIKPKTSLPSPTTKRGIPKSNQTRRQATSPSKESPTEKKIDKTQKELVTQMDETFICEECSER